MESFERQVRGWYPPSISGQQVRFDRVEAMLVALIVLLFDRTRGQFVQAELFQF
jgi:hypothetical protein